MDSMQCTAKGGSLSNKRLLKVMHVNLTKEQAFMENVYLNRSRTHMSKRPELSVN